jgi:hypothetical protein
MTRKRWIYSILAFALTLTGCQEEFEKRLLLYSSDVMPVDGTTVVISTSLLDNPGHSILSHGYCWSTEPAPTMDSDTIKISGSFDKTFEGTVKNLKTGTQYYLRAYIVTDNGTVVYGNELKFLNNFFSAFLRTRLNAMTKSYYEVSSIIRFNGDTAEEQGHVWATAPHPTIEDDHLEGTLTEVGDELYSFSARLNSLTPTVTYYVRPYTKNAWGVAYGSEIILKVPTEIVTGNWEEMNVAEAGLFHYSIFQEDEMLYFITGTDGTTSREFRRESYSVNLATDEVRILAEYPGSSAAVSGFAINGKVFVQCGRETEYDGEPCFLFWEYDPAIDEWRLNSSLEPYYSADVHFMGTFEDYGYMGSVNADGYLYLSMYDPNYDYWFVADAIPVPEGSFIGAGTTSAPDGQFIYFNMSDDIAVYDFYNGGYRIIDFPGPEPPAQSGDPIKFFFFQNDLYVITDELEVFALDDVTGGWSRRTSIPSFAGPGSIFVGSYQGRPLIGTYYLEDYLSFYLDDYSMWYQYSE